MKPFQFSLQSLRALREQKERLAQRRYAATLQACKLAAERVQEASSELTGCWTALQEKLSAGVAGTELLRARAWCNVLELRLKERAGILEEARHAADSVWHEMLAATRDREALERYREKRRREYDREAQRDEQKRLDELAVQVIDSPSPLRYTPRREAY